MLPTTSYRRIRNLPLSSFSKLQIIRAYGRAIIPGPIFLNQNQKIQHNDLKTFLKETSNSTDKTSNTHLGTLYEYTVMEALKRFGMKKLSRTGGRGDGGIDLLGTWDPPTPSNINLPTNTLAIYAQCKAERLKSGPRHFRELEGALGQVHTGSAQFLGILASLNPCTPGATKHMLMSKKPLAYICVASHNDGGYTRQFLWNNVAAEILGQNLSATTSYVARKPPGGELRGPDEEIREEVVLTLDGEIIS